MGNVTGEVTVAVEAASHAPGSTSPLAVGDGISVRVSEPAQAGLFEVRLVLPPEPSPDAIPAAIHRDDTGRIRVEPVLWDEAANEAILYTDTFSDRWGAWYDPRNWLEEVVQVAQGAWDFAFDFITGRTDPPACADDAPDWGRIEAFEVSSLHVCTQRNVDGDRERFELLLKSNRNTAQAVTIPVTTKDYVWVENQPDIVRDALVAVAGVEDNSVVLLGGGELSMGFPRPGADAEFEMIRYTSNTLAVLNPLLAFLGRAPVEDVLLAYTVAGAKCVSEIAGVDVTQLDAVPDDVIDGPAALQQLVTCALELLQEPRLIADILSELLIAADVGDAAYRADVATRTAQRLKGVASVAKRVANVISVAGSVTQLWDVVFDGLSDGRISGQLDGPPPRAPVLAWTAAGIDGLAWGTSHSDSVAMLRSLFGEPAYTSDTVGDLCGNPHGRLLRWDDDGRLLFSVYYSPEDRLGSVSFRHGAIPHANAAIGEGTPVEELLAAEPGTIVDGPIPDPFDPSGPDYWEWRWPAEQPEWEYVETGGLGGGRPAAPFASGSLSDGGARVEGFVHLTGPELDTRCGE